MTVHMMCVKPIEKGRRECIIYFRTKDKITGKFVTEKRLHKVGASNYYDFKTQELLDQNDPYVKEFEEKLRSVGGVMKDFRWKKTAKREEIRVCVKTYKNDLDFECIGEFYRYRINGEDGIFSGKIKKKKYHKDDLMYLSFQLVTEGLKSNTIAKILGISQQYASKLTKELKFIDEKNVKGADETDWI